MTTSGRSAAKKRRVACWSVRSSSLEVAHDEVLVAGLVQGAQDRAADEAGVPGEVDAGRLADEVGHALILPERHRPRAQRHTAEGTSPDEANDVRR